MFNYKITPHFALSEFFVTNQGLIYECELIASFCVILRNIILSREKKVEFMPISNNIIRLAGFLESFRNNFNVPIKITSGYRSEELNKKVGGSKESKHRVGLAADIYFSGVDTYNKPIKFPCGTKHTPAKVTAMCDFLKDKKSSGALSELIIHDNYIHIAL